VWRAKALASFRLQGRAQFFECLGRCPADGAVLRQATLKPQPCQSTEVTLIRICLGDALFPESFRLQVVLQDFFSLRRIVELDALHAFASPVEEEFGGGLADAVVGGANLDKKGGGGGE